MQLQQRKLNSEHLAGHSEQFQLKPRGLESELQQKKIDYQNVVVSRFNGVIFGGCIWRCSNAFQLSRCKKYVQASANQKSLTIIY